MPCSAMRSRSVIAIFEDQYVLCVNAVSSTAEQLTRIEIEMMIVHERERVSPYALMSILMRVVMVW